MNIKPGIAVLVIGPTVTGSPIAIGCSGTVDRWVAPMEPIPEWDGGATRAAAAGWLVALNRKPMAWLDTYHANFPASSLMPLDSEQQDETESTNTPIPAEVA